MLTSNEANLKVNPIAKIAELRLKTDGLLRSHNLTVVCEDGCLIIKGCVPSYYYKQMAQEAIRTIGLDNQLIIKNLILVRINPEQ